MKNKLGKIILVLSMLTILVQLTHISAFAMPGYTITDIHFPGSDTTIGFSINNFGQIVGTSYYAGSYHAFFWENGIMSIIGEGSFRDINNSGQVVGHLWDGPIYRPVLWDNGSIIYPDMLGLRSVVRHINDSGQVCGSSDLDGNYHAILWEDGSATQILPGTDYSYAIDINDFGQVLIWGAIGQVIWESSGLIIVGYENTFQAEYINNHAQVVGTIVNGYWRPGFWENGTVIELPIPDWAELGQYTWGEAQNINDLGQIVGWVETKLNGEDVRHALLWDNGVVYDLNDKISSDSGWVIEQARDINERGQIVGRGELDGERHGYLLTPNPIPNVGSCGTKITITGEVFGDKQGKVYIGTEKCKVLEWDDSSIQCSLESFIEPGTYHVTIELKEPKGTDSIIIEEAFTIKTPMCLVNPLHPISGKSGEDVTVTGYFFGSKKGSVFVNELPCKVVKWEMDVDTGKSEVEFLVPADLPPGEYDLTVEKTRLAPILWNGVSQ